MDDAEKKRLRREVLEEVGSLLFEHLAAQEWGRVLVEIAADDAGQPIVAGMETAGVRIDPEILHKQSRGFAERMHRPLIRIGSL